MDYSMRNSGELEIYTKMLFSEAIYDSLGVDDI